MAKQERKETAMNPNPPQLNESDLTKFSGDDVRYVHPINPRIVYTPGIKYVADQAQAFWLVDAIASWIGSRKFLRAAQRDERIKSLHFWKLKVKPNCSAILTARADSSERPFVRQAIEYTDFPLQRIDIWAAADEQRWLLYLPSEH